MSGIEFTLETRSSVDLRRFVKDEEKQHTHFSLCCLNHTYLNCISVGNDMPSISNFKALTVI